MAYWVRFLPPSSWHKAAFVCLFSMILMRLVWVQLRNYDLHYGDIRTQVFFEEILPTHSPPCKKVFLDGNVRRFEIASTPNELRELSFVSQHFFYMLCAFNRNELSPGSIEKANQTMFFVIVFFSAAFVRLLSQSWILAMAAAVIVLSRGHLITRIEVVGVDPMMQIFLLMGFVSLVHFLKSGSIWSFCFFLCSSLVASFIDASAASALLVLPLILTLGFFLRRILMQPLLHRLRADHIQMQQLLQRGGLKLYKGGVINGALSWVINRLINRPDEHSATGSGYSKFQGKPRFWSGLNQPFSLWVFQRRRWFAFTLIQLGFLSIFLLVNFSLRLSSFSDFGTKIQHLQKTVPEIFLMWITPAAEIIDVHLGVSMLLVVVCMMLSPARGLPRMFETSWALFVTLFLFLSFGFCFDLVFWIGNFEEDSLNFAQSIYQFSRSDAILLWLEPVFLCFGLISIYQLILVGEEKIE